MFAEIIEQLHQVPEYFIALKAALAVLASAFPIYVGLRYFLYKRRLAAPLSLTLNFLSVFLLFGGLAFLLASPLAGLLAPAIVTVYLFVTCFVAALAIVSLVDLFLIQHYLSAVKKMYISPPLRTVLKLAVFIMALLPILRFILHFNPLALVAIPTIATAGIAFALQDTLKAFIAGVGLGHLIRLGEWISFQDKEGRVIDISWARTTLETRDGQRVFIPNSLLQTGIFINYTTGNPANRQCLKISASYDAPPDRVKETLVRCARGVPGIAPVPPPQALLADYAESAMVYGLYYWLDDYSRRLDIQDDVMTRAWYAFRREGISIPYPTRTLHRQRDSGLAKTSRPTIEESLKQWNLAAAFIPEELQELSKWAKTRDYGPGEVIVRQGEEGRSLFFIVEGHVEVFVAPAVDRPVAALGPRDIFGEMSLLTGEPRSATVRAKTAVDTIEIEKTGLEKIIAQRPDLSDRLAELVVKRKSALATLSEDRKSLTLSSQADADIRPLAKKIRAFFGLP